MDSLHDNMLKNLKPRILSLLNWISQKEEGNELWIIVFLLLGIILVPVLIIIWLIEIFFLGACWIYGKKKIMALLITALLIFPPLVFPITWYFVDKKEIHDFFHNFNIPAQSFRNEQEFEQYINSRETSYEAGKDSYFTFILPKEEAGQETFKSVASNKVLETLGILSTLPTHEICLENRNTFSYGAIVLPEWSKENGAIGVKQKNGHEFYAEIGLIDCQHMSRKSFENSETYEEYGYEGKAKLYSDGHIEIISFSIDPSKTFWTIKVKGWALIALYFLVLPAWSLLFFQYKKILDFLKEEYGKLG